MDTGLFKINVTYKQFVQKYRIYIYIYIYIYMNAHTKTQT